MKIVFSLVAFFLTLALSSQTLASPPPESASKGAHKAAGHDPHSNHSLFPPPQPNKAKSTPPEASATLAPAFMAKISSSEVEIKWQPLPNVQSYHLQVATDANFKWLTVNEPLYQGASYNLKGLEKGISYYWRVAGVKPENSPTYIKGPFVKSMFETAK